MGDLTRADSAAGPPPILVALCGMSPGVLTATTWALAHEQPPVIPDRLVVFTTASGRRAIREELLDSGVWETLTARLGTGPLGFGPSADAIRVFPSRDRVRDLEDIVTPDDQQAVADFLLGQLRELSLRGQRRLIVSVAGGRKTMGVLCAQVLALVGGLQDRLVHVLVPPPFDRPDLRPRFYFPNAGPDEHVVGATGDIVRAADARVMLTDVPYVPLRDLLRGVSPDEAAGFMELVGAARRDLQAHAAPPSLLLRGAAGLCVINGTRVPLNALEFAILATLAERRKAGGTAFHGYQELLDAVAAWAGDQDYRSFDLIEQFEEMLANKTADDFRKVVYGLRRKLGESLPERLADACDPRVPGRRGLLELQLPPDAIRI